MFISVNCVLISFRKSFSINVYVRMLHRIAALLWNSVLVYQSSESGNVVQIVSKSKLSALVASKKSRRRRPPIPDLQCAYNRERKSSLFILNRNLVRPSYRLTSVQAVVSNKLTTRPYVHDFYTQFKAGLKILSGSILRSFRRKPNFVRGRAV